MEELAWYSLNPYSIGIWSATSDEKATEIGEERVLILILLEYGLRLLQSWQLQLNFATS